MFDKKEKGGWGLSRPMRSKEQMEAKVAIKMWRRLAVAFSRHQPRGPCVLSLAPREAVPDPSLAAASVQWPSLSCRLRRGPRHVVTLCPGGTGSGPRAQKLPRRPPVTREPRFPPQPRRGSRACACARACRWAECGVFGRELRSGALGAPVVSRVEDG